MSSAALIILILLFFITSIIGVVTGSNSLITVPVMFQFGIDEKEAIATNMFGLTFMSVGATIPFLRTRVIDVGKVKPMIALTVIGSALGAILVGLIENHGLKLIVSGGMITVALFTLIKRDTPDPYAARPIVAYVLTFVLAIYGGLYSGGYVTMLTAVYVAFFAMPFAEAVGSTKLINIFSSLVATLIFAWQGLIDYKLGAMLAVTMFIGAYIGAHYATRMNEVWLRRLFLATVLLLAAKTLYDVVAALFFV